MQWTASWDRTLLADRHDGVRRSGRPAGSDGRSQYGAEVSAVSGTQRYINRRWATSGL